MVPAEPYRNNVGKNQYELAFQFSTDFRFNIIIMSLFNALIGSKSFPKKVQRILNQSKIFVHFGYPKLQ